MSKVFCIVVILFTTACSTTKYKVIHNELSIPDNCIFENLTADEYLHVLPGPLDENALTIKDTMIESVGRKIYRNQENCKVRQSRINSVIEAHNKAHKND